MSYKMSLEVLSWNTVLHTKEGDNVKDMFKAHFFYKKSKKFKNYRILAKLFIIFHIFSEKFRRETQ